MCMINKWHDKLKKKKRKRRKIFENNNLGIKVFKYYYFWDKLLFYECKMHKLKMMT